MLISVKGYYNGNQIVMEEDIQLSAGQEVIVTVLDTKKPQKEKIDLKKYMGRGAKLFKTDAQDYIRELRDNDRIYKF